MSSIIMSEEFLAKAKAVNSFEELKALVSAEGVEVADTELMDAWERVSESAGKGKFKLTEEELDNVAGGCGGNNSNNSSKEVSHDGCAEYMGHWYRMTCASWGCMCGYKPNDGRMANCCGDCCYFAQGDGGSLCKNMLVD